MFLVPCMIRYGVSLARSVELTIQRERILAAGPLYPVALNDFSAVRGLGLGDFHHVVSDVHHRLSDFIHQVVWFLAGMRLFGSGVIGFGKTLWFIPTGLGFPFSLPSVSASPYSWSFWSSC